MKYKEICEQFNLPKVSGKQKQLQLEDLKRYCNYIKEGTNYTILEVYPTPLPKEDKRLLTLPYIEYIVKSVLSTSDNNELYVSAKELLRLCYIINNNYLSILTNKTFNSLYITNKYHLDESFLIYTDRLYDILKPTVISALKSMENKKEIILATGYKLRKDKTIVNAVSQSSELGQEIFRIQGENMIALGIEKYSDLFGRHISKQQEFFNLCDIKTKENSLNNPLWIKNNWDYDGFYQCYNIICNTDKIKYDLKLLSKNKQELNKIINHKVHFTKLLKEISPQFLDQYFFICNTNEGDVKYPIVEDIKKIT